MVDVEEMEPRGDELPEIPDMMPVVYLIVVLFIVMGFIAHWGFFLFAVVLLMAIIAYFAFGWGDFEDGNDAPGGGKGNGGGGDDDDGTPPKRFPPTHFNVADWTEDDDLVSTQEKELVGG